MFNPLPSTKEKFLSVRKLPLNENLDKLPENMRENSLAMNKITTELRDLAEKIDYDEVKSVPMSDEFVEYKKLPLLEPVKVNGESVANAHIVIAGNERAIERLEHYKKSALTMFEKDDILSKYITLNTDLLIHNHKGHILSIRKYIDENST